MQRGVRATIMDITTAIGISAEKRSSKSQHIFLKNHAKKFDFLKIHAIIPKNKYGYERHTLHL